jgi:hypothetical protein
LPVTFLVEVKTAVLPQVASSGPNNLKVIVPVGVAPLESVAVSEMLPPTGAVAEACVVIAGLAGATTRYFASLGMPLVKTVTRAGPEGKPLTGIELKAVSDHPTVGSTRRNATWLLSMLRSWTIG